MSLYVFGRSLGLLPVLAVLVVGFPALIFQEMKETKPEKTGHVNFFRRHVDPMDPLTLAGPNVGKLPGPVGAAATRLTSFRFPNHPS